MKMQFEEGHTNKISYPLHHEYASENLVIIAWTHLPSDMV